VRSAKPSGLTRRHCTSNLQPAAAEGRIIAAERGFSVDRFTSRGAAGGEAMSGIESIMHRDVITVEPTASVAEAAKTMREFNLGALVVIDGDGIQGIFSERDIMNRVVAEGRDPTGVPVGEVCTPEPKCVDATASVAECYDVLMKEGFRHLIIRDASNRPVGIVSARDFLRCLMVQHETEISIEDTCARLGQLTVLMERMEELR
jgi:CBS domain-containing protein